LGAAAHMHHNKNPNITSQTPYRNAKSTLPHMQQDFARAIGLTLGLDVQLLLGKEVGPHALHVLPVLHDAVLDGVLDLHQTAVCLFVYM
jgi:hypothetical protein